MDYWGIYKTTGYKRDLYGNPIKDEPLYFEGDVTIIPESMYKNRDKIKSVKCFHPLDVMVGLVI